MQFSNIASELAPKFLLFRSQVALFGGLISHADGLIASAIGCFEKLDYTDGYFLLYYQQMLTIIYPSCMNDSARK